MFLVAAGVAAGLAGTLYLGIRIFVPWIHYDLQYIRTVFSGIRMFEKAARGGAFLVDLFEGTVNEYPDKAFIVFRDRAYSYKVVNEKANQVARAALELGLQQGDTVAVMMYNEPAFVWTYIGLQKLGLEQAFINHNLRSKSLSHCIKICKAKYLILGQGKDLENAVKEIKDDLEDIKVYSQEQDIASLPNDFNSFHELMTSASTRGIGKNFRSEVTLSSVNVYIFTSGTTGLPKPAIVTQMKTLRGASVMMAFMGFDDRLYETLPLYHSAATILGLGATLSIGATMILTEKFSASRFMDDCRKYNVTVIHYVGELCRYLVNTPANPDDKFHMIKVAFGNGLRKDVWAEFQRRFKIPNIVEFYGATENPIGFMNTCNKFGSVGRSSPFLRRLAPCTFVEYDHKTEQPMRDSKTGFCIESAPGSVGLLIIPIQKGITFEGYKGQELATQKRYLHDVFQKGDVFINGGDLFFVDEEYFVYFHDRVGDTFRWKGENVSTTEVANAVSSLDFIHDANVYGVLVPGAEGRAGMATICLKDEEKEYLSESDLSAVSKTCKELLPSYARPRFLRIQKELEITSTFKQRKMTLQKEGFDVTTVREALYYYDSKTLSYCPLQLDIYQQIIEGTLSI